MTLRRKLAWSLVAVVVIVVTLTGVVDDTSERYAANALKRALVTFAVARTLNGVISVAQGTELALEPGGVGVIFTLGQVLDPINDLVERFSSVMLVAASSLGLQNVLLGMAGWWGTSLVTVIACGLALIALWLPAKRPGRASLAIRFLLIMLFVRFAVPLIVIGTNIVFDTFLAAEQDAATAALESTSARIEKFSEEAAPPSDQDRSLAERLGSMIDDSVSAMNVRERLDRLGDRIAGTSEHIIMLIVIFVLETVIMPIVFVWLLLQVLKSLVERATRRPD
ncbi:MAG: hypothetical protein ACWGPN_12200 [Gammaproteobacteria bacterium]